MVCTSAVFSLVMVHVYWGFQVPCHNISYSGHAQNISIQNLHQKVWACPELCDKGPEISSSSPHRPVWGGGGETSKFVTCMPFAPPPLPVNLWVLVAVIIDYFLGKFIFDYVFPQRCPALGLAMWVLLMLFILLVQENLVHLPSPCLSSLTS